jgi:hypothetical protein
MDNSRLQGGILSALPAKPEQPILASEIFKRLGVNCPSPSQRRVSFEVADEARPAWPCPSPAPPERVRISLGKGLNDRFLRAQADQGMQKMEPREGCEGYLYYI